MKQPEWKLTLVRLYLDNQKAKYPNAFEAAGGYTQKVKSYSDKNTNGLTRCVKDFLTFKGHYCIRTARQGQARIERVLRGGTQQDMKGNGVKTYGKLTFTKNPEAKAFTDLQVSIGGIYFAVEIKCAATKDTIKANQKENIKLVEQSGAYAIIVPDMETFYNWYNNDLPKILSNFKIKS
jgi:hypothetical protein